jgi:hypothetical protein
MGGAPEASAKPSPNGKATKDTTKPGRTFFDIDLREGILIPYLA